MWLLISLLLGHKLTWSILALKRVLLNAEALAKFIMIHFARILVESRYINFVACIHPPTIQHSFPKIGLDFQIEFLKTNHQTSNKQIWLKTQYSQLDYSYFQEDLIFAIWQTLTICAYTEYDLSQLLRKKCNQKFTP